eukprot:Amastigsp_a6480_7.p2 type:complete len:246 gc:universal Amastigsp_a6480_7:618-1355(+)
MRPRARWRSGSGTRCCSLRRTRSSARSLHACSLSRQTTAPAGRSRRSIFPRASADGSPRPGCSAGSRTRCSASTRSQQRASRPSSRTRTAFCLRPQATAHSCTRTRASKAHSCTCLLTRAAHTRPLTLRTGPRCKRSRSSARCTLPPERSGRTRRATSLCPPPLCAPPTGSAGRLSRGRRQAATQASRALSAAARISRSGRARPARRPRCSYGPAPIGARCSAPPPRARSSRAHSPDPRALRRIS